MKFKDILFVSTGFLLVLINSCSKVGPVGATGNTGPQGPPGPAYTGAIYGHVSLYDKYGSKILTGLNKPLLTLTGTTSLNPDSTGYYEFPNLTTGEYYITASDSGFAATRFNNFEFVKDTLYRDIKMSAIPDFNPLTLFTAKTAANNGDSISLSFPVDLRLRNCIIFINNKSNVNNNPNNYLAVYTKAIGTSGTSMGKATIIIPAQDLNNYGFTSGNWVYIAAYGYVVNDYSSYEDLATGKNVYNAVSGMPLIDSIQAP